MQKYQNNVTGRNGDVVIGGSVLVKLAGTATPATIYSDDGVTPVTNPLTTDANGYFEFYVADGLYDITVNGQDAYTSVLIVDALTGLAGRPTNSALAASGAAAAIGTTAGTVQSDINARPTTAALAAAEGVDLLAYAAADAQSILDNGVPLQTYAQLLAYNKRGVGVQITTPGISGAFRYNAALANTTNGVTQFAHISGVGAWERLYDGVVNAQWAGILPSPANCNDAMRVLASFVEAQSGGVSILFPPLEYKVGKQVLAGATGLGYSFKADDCFRVSNCTKPVVIYCNGAVFRNDPTMRYGAFNPVTGAAAVSSTSNPDWSASYPAVFRFKSNASVRMFGAFEVDGNQNNGVVNNFMTFEDWGYGLHFDNNSNVQVDSVYAHHNPTDNIYVADPGLLASDPKKPHVFGSVRLEYSGRNNFTVVGSNNVTVQTGVSSNAGGSIVQKLPKSNWHLERQSSVIDDTVFMNCHARGVGTGFNLGSANRVTLIGCTGEIPRSKFTTNLVAQNCKFNGNTSADPISDITVSPNYPHYIDTIFDNTGDAAGLTMLNFGSGAASLTRVRATQSFADTSTLMATVNAGADVANLNFTDCVFVEAGTSATATQITANFFGRSTLSAARNINYGATQLFGDLLLTGTTPAGSSLTNMSGAGRLFISGIESPIPGKKQSSYYRAVQYSGNDGVSSNAPGRQIFDYRTTQLVTAYGAANVGDLIWNTKQDVPCLAFRAMTAGATPTVTPVAQIGLITSIAAAPPFLPCFAFVGGVGYMAAGTSSAADWKQIT